MYIFYFVSFISQYAQSNTEILTAGQGQLVLDELCTDLQILVIISLVQLKT